MAVSISVIIPVLHEQQRINALITHLRAQDAACEIIVVDGDDAGTTIELITDPSVVRMTTARGRGNQLAAGAAVATGEVILMLHADTLLPENGLAMIRQVIADGAEWGAFRLGIHAQGFAYRCIEHMVDLRCKLFSLPYGDQAVFVTRKALQLIGGIPATPLMEDVALARRLTAVAGSCNLLSLRVQTSARRWQQDGILQRTLKNWWLLLRYLFGADPAELEKEYR